MSHLMKPTMIEFHKRESRTVYSFKMIVFVLLEEQVMQPNLKHAPIFRNGLKEGEKKE